MANNKRISIITKELNDSGVDVANKDIIAFLESKGIEGKKHSSAVDENIEKLILEHYGKGSGKASEKPVEASKTQGNKKETKEIGAGKVAESKTVESKNTDTKAQMNTGNGEKSAAAKAQAQGQAQGQTQGHPQSQGNPQGNPQGQPKKKKIFFTVNNNGNGAARQSGNMSTGRTQGNTGGGYRPGGIIKPSVKPSPTPTVNIIRPGDQQNKKKFVHREEGKEVQPNQAKPSGNPVQASQNTVNPNAENTAARPNTSADRNTSAERNTGNTAANRNVTAEDRNQSYGNRNGSAGDRNQSYGNRNGSAGDRNQSYGNRNGSAGGYGSGAGSDRRSTGGAYARNNSQTQNGRQTGNTGDRNNKRGGDSQNRFGSNGRPGAKTSAFRGNKGFEAASPAPEKGGNRRKQGDIKHKRDDYERGDFGRRDEEKENKKFNPHGFKKPVVVEKPQEEEIKVITIPDTLTIKELADHMRMQPSVIIKKLFLSGQIVTVNSELTFEEAENIAADYDILCEQEKMVDVIAELLKEDPENEEKMEKRPPVVCVMGHVDHGKTSLLDYIRKAHVTDKEAGGITQAIGAYTVNIKGSQITFLDTPGHEAFTAMRMRGANATDIVILVVAADDGVMPQTVEAINHAKAAGVEIIVAVNKIDKPNANIDRVKQELSEYELISEDWGGSTTFVPVSAKTGQGVDDLLEMILLEADVMELKANAKRQARGMVIEAQLDKGRGAVATVLVQKGTLHVGDFVACGMSHGRVRAMIDDKGKRVKEAGPSMPVEILGLDEVPEAGEIFVSPESEKEAQEFANTYNEQHKKELLSETRKKSVSLDDIYSQIKEGDLKEFNIIIKADVQGSVEALKASLLKLSNDEIAVKVIHGGVGAINESDVVLASASNAIIIGFNVRPDNTAKQIAETENVDIHLYKIIYQALEDVESAMKGMLGPVYEERTIGHGEIRQVFKASGIGKIAGSYVTDGIVEKACSVKITRNGEELFDGPLSSLKRFKDDVKEVKEGFECGLVFDGFDDVEEGDLLEFHKQFEVERN
ncbi:MAG: translation initiation factor IF-2 [Lachnospiraceae bacterium]|nr:translation initiation factor IF-2 [Lachnospiraceae bacterium]